MIYLDIILVHAGLELLLSILFSKLSSFATGVSAIARSLGASLTPVISTLLTRIPALLNAPFIFAGVSKIDYVLLYVNI
jgi:hypothetical protein